MVRNTTFSRIDVVTAAIAVIDAEGIAQLTARKVADKMGASTAPVYSNFNTMEELADAALMMAVETMMGLMEKPGVEQQFIDIGEGVLLFAKEHPHLYAALFLQPSSTCDYGPKLIEPILDKMATFPELIPLPPVERVILLKKMAIFTHGLATDICNGFLDQFQWPEIMLLLKEVGDSLVSAALSAPPREKKEMDLLGTFWFKCNTTTNDIEDRQTEGEPND